MCSWTNGKFSLAHSFSPRIILSSGAREKEPSGTIVAPMASYSLEAKVNREDSSSYTLNPESINCLVVEGVGALISAGIVLLLSKE